MKTDFEIVAGRDYQGDKCYRINYIEYDTLYTIPETHYTKKAAKEALKKIKAENECKSPRWNEPLRKSGRPKKYK